MEYNNKNSVDDRELQQTYWDLFVNRSDIYAVQQENGKYSSVNASLTPELLFGNKTVGLYQLDRDSKVKWVVIDFDIKKEVAKDDPNFSFDEWREKMQRQVKSVSDLLANKGIPHYIEFSGFRGYHIWTFFEEAIEASKAKAWLDGMSREFESLDENITYELFPKQAALEVSKEGIQGLGSLVKAPLQRHLRTGNYTYFVNSDFNKIEGLPEIEFCHADQLAISEEVKIKQAPRNFTGLKQNITQDGSFPVPDNILKMVNGCRLVKEIVRKAEEKHHLLNEERVIVASLGRFYGEEGIRWVHSVLSNCTDYNEDTTNYHISKLSHAPAKCETMRENLKTTCKECRNTWSTPLSLGYTTIQEHFAASSEFILRGYVPQLLDRLGLSFNESANHYIVEYRGTEYFTSKSKGTWLGKFNLVDFIRFIRPGDWEVFLHQNFPDITIDKFAYERTDKKIDEIFEYDGGEIQVNRYVSEADRQIEAILTDNSNYNIIADTGMGKTEALIRKIKEKNLKAIFLTPYESNARQLQEKYQIFSVHGKVKIENIKDELVKGNLIASTYDGLRKIMASQISPEEYILFVDEVHNIVTHANFREHALGNILRNMHEFRKVITITGTPEGVLNNDYRKVRFVRVKRANLISDYTIMVSKADPVSAVIESIIEGGHKGKVVIFKNSIRSLEEIREVLLEKGVKEEEIQILNSQERDSETYNQIVKEEKIPDTVNYILTTSVISDGVNIGNEDIDAVYLLECDNLILLRQFIARFRKGVKKVFDIIPKAPDCFQGARWFDYPVELKRITAKYEDIANTKTVFLRECGLIQNPGKTDFIKKMFGKLSREMDFLRLSRDTGEVEVNYQLLTYDVLSDFHRVAYLNPDKRKEYLEHTLNQQVTTREIAASAVDTSQAREKVRARMEENKTKLIELLNSKPKETITCYLKHVNPNMIRNAEEYLQDIYLRDLPSGGFFEQNRSLLKLKEAERLISKYVTFTRYKFPHGFIIEMLGKSQSELYDFELGYLTQLVLYMVSNHQKILKYSRRSLKVFYYAVFKFVLDYFKENKNFTYDGLLRDLNSYLLKTRVTEERVGKGVLAEVLRRTIKKVKWTRKEGEQTRTLGWKFTGYTTVADLVGNDPDKVEIIRNSLRAYLEDRIAFARFNLLIDSLRGEGESEENTEQLDLLNNLKRDLGRLSQ